MSKRDAMHVLINRLSLSLETGVVRSAQLLTLLTLAACGYELQGKVVEGDGSILVGRAGDPESRRSGLGGASVELIRDPDTMNRTVIARATSGADGQFILDVQGFGAGWMSEPWLIRVRRAGCENVQSVVQLPSSSKDRMLFVTLHRGKSLPFKEPDNARSIMDEAKAWDTGVGTGRQP